MVLSQFWPVCTVWPSKIRPLVKKQMLTDFFQKWMEQFFSNFDMLFSTIIASNFWIDTPLAHSWPCHWAKRPWPPWWCTPWTWWPTPHWRRPSLSPYWSGKSYIGPKVHLAQHPIVLGWVAWQGRPQMLARWSLLQIWMILAMWSGALLIGILMSSCLLLS